VLDRRFRFGENRTTLGRDTVTGVTTFIVMSYIVYVLVRLFQGQWARVHPLMYGAAIAVTLNFLVPLLQQEFDFI